jgi:hypothetical protein
MAVAVGGSSSAAVIYACLRASQIATGYIAQLGALTRRCSDRKEAVAVGVFCFCMPCSVRRSIMDVISGNLHFNFEPSSGC